MAIEINLLTASLLVGAIWSIICRIRYMDPARTRTAVFVQHAALALGLFAAFWLPPAYAKLALAAGVFLFLMFGAKRWRHEAPADTDSPAKVVRLNDDPIDFTERNWKHVQGGKQ